jgi:hypothetical protein
LITRFHLLLLGTLSSPPQFPSPIKRQQVVRYTALASGIVYGVVHRKTLQDRFDAHAAEKEVQLRQHWLEEAKKAWAQKQLQSKDSRAFSPSPCHASRS